jgi:hypothetical protein
MKAHYVYQYKKRWLNGWGNNKNKKGGIMILNFEKQIPNYLKKFGCNDDDIKHIMECATENTEHYSGNESYENRMKIKNKIALNYGASWMGLIRSPWAR